MVTDRDLDELRRYWAKAVRRKTQASPEDVDDIVGAAFLKAMVSGTFEKFDPERGTTLKGYFGKLVMAATNDYLLKRWKGRLHVADVALDEHIERDDTDDSGERLDGIRHVRDCEPEVIAREEVERLRTSVAGLHPHAAVTVDLLLEHYRQEDIGEVLNCSVRTVQKIVGMVRDRANYLRGLEHVDTDA